MGLSWNGKFEEGWFDDEFQFEVWIVDSNGSVDLIWTLDFHLKYMDCEFEVRGLDFEGMLDFWTDIRILNGGFLSFEIESLKFKVVLKFWSDLDWFGVLNWVWSLRFELEVKFEVEYWNFKCWGWRIWMLKWDIGNWNVKFSWILEIVKIEVLYWNVELVNVGYCTIECWLGYWNV